MHVPELESLYASHVKLHPGRPPHSSSLQNAKLSSRMQSQSLQEVSVNENTKAKAIRPDNIFSS